MYQNTGRMSLDVDKFIKEIQCRPCIWMTKHPQHRNRKILVRVWNELHAMFPVLTVLQLKKKWKNIKDHYRKEVKKHRANGEDAQSVWTHFEHLNFLEEQVTTNPSEDQPDDDSDDEDTSDSASTSDQPQSKKKRLSDNSEIRRVFLDLEQKKLKMLQENLAKNLTQDTEKCDDYHFFMSLIPQMKKFDDVVKMRVRTKISQVILEEAENLTFVERGFKNEPENPLDSF